MIHQTDKKDQFAGVATCAAAAFAAADAVSRRVLRARAVVLCVLISSLTWATTGVYITLLRRSKVLSDSSSAARIFLIGLTREYTGARVISESTLLRSMSTCSKRCCDAFSLSIAGASLSVVNASVYSGFPISRSRALICCDSTEYDSLLKPILCVSSSVYTLDAASATPGSYG